MKVESMKPAYAAGSLWGADGGAGERRARRVGVPVNVGKQRYSLTAERA